MRQAALSHRPSAWHSGQGCDLHGTLPRRSSQLAAGSCHLSGQVPAHRRLKQRDPAIDDYCILACSSRQCLQQYRGSNARCTHRAGLQRPEVVAMVAGDKRGCEETARTASSDLRSATGKAHGGFPLERRKPALKMFVVMCRCKENRRPVSVTAARLAPRRLGPGSIRWQCGQPARADTVGTRARCGPPLPLRAWRTPSFLYFPVPMPLP